jgi:hypothetical protein
MDARLLERMTGRGKTHMTLYKCMFLVATGITWLSITLQPARSQPQGTEGRLVRSIKFLGMNPLSITEILDRFQERKLGIDVEQPYDSEQVTRAAAALKELLAERGRKGFNIEVETREASPRGLEIRFRTAPAD